jgi:hypothetical protein
MPSSSQTSQHGAIALMTEAIPYDLFLRVKESVRAILRDDNSRNPSSTTTDDTLGLQYCPRIARSLR